jgi:PAS domain S-box-containing protein
MVRARRIGFLGFWLPGLLIVLLLCGTRETGAQTPPSDTLGAKKVLVLHAFESQAPVFAQTDSGLSKVLLAGGVPLENQFFDSLDLRRNPDPAYRRVLLEQLQLKYRHRSFDLTVTIYPEALDFVLNEAQALFADTPLLALYMPDDAAAPTTDANRPIVWHAARLDFRGTLEIALTLVPAAKRVFVVSGAHPVDRRQEERARVALKPWENQLEFRYLSGLPMEGMLTALAGAPRDSVVLLLPVSSDVAGNVYFSPDVAQRVAQASAAPVFGVLESSLGRGIVGGVLYSFEHVGASAGRLALEILRGGPSSGAVPSVLEVPPAPMFDWRVLKRWHLSVDAVPPGSLFINREYTLWEQYRTAVIVATFVLVVQSLLIVSLVVNRVQRQRVERQLAGQLRIETLLADLSARFVHLPAGQIEGAIQDAQRRICEALDLDRSSLLQVPPDQPDTMRMTHVHTPSETPPIPARMDMRDFTPWALQALLRGEALAVSTLSALPPEAARDRENLQRYGTKSVVAIPLFAEGAAFGALTFAATRAEREWQEEVVKGFHMVAEVIANALVRSRADQALRDSQARLTLAAASADARLWEVDPETARVWMTEEGRAFYGVTSPEVLTLEQVASSIHVDDRESWRQSMQQALESGQPMRTEFRAIRPDGSVHWIVSQGRLHAGATGERARLLGVSIDITDRRRIEEQLRTSEALSSGVLSSLPGHMVIVDRSGAMLRTSDAWREFAAGDGALDPTVLAVGAGNCEARPRADQEVAQLAQRVRNGIAAVLAGTQADVRLEYPYPTPTETRWASISVQPLLRPEGGAVLYHQDITRQRLDRLETERLRRDLTHVGRVTTMGEMAAALAHELNQPLTAILSNAHAGERYLAQAAPPLGEIREILQDVVGDARRAGEVIQRLRSLLRKDETKFLALDINIVVREMAVLTHTEAVLRNLTVDLELASDLPPVRGDRVQLLQVLLNLVVNGMEAMGAQAEGRRIEIRTARGAEAVRVAVRDEGPGIPPEMLKEIFETFYTTKPKGMGMGLAISRSIVEAHGGQLWAENNPDRGATFWFTLPVCPPEPPPPHQPTPLTGFMAT